MKKHTKLRDIHSIILLLTILKNNVLASYPNWMASSTNTTTGIANLNEYLDLFSDCLIHIINYSGGDFVPLTSPAVISRYFLIVRRESTKSNSDDAFDWYFTPIKPEGVYNDRNDSMNSSKERLLYKLLIRSSSYNWRCRAQFYLYPPEHFMKFNPAKNTFIQTSWFLPPLFRNFWNRFSTGLFIKSNIHRPLNGNYHVLVQREGCTLYRWFNNIDLLRTLELQARAIILTTKGAQVAVKPYPLNITKTEVIHQYSRSGSDNPEHDPDHRIITIEILCQFCDKYYRTTVPFLLPLTRYNLDSEITAISQINNGIPWYVENLNDEVDKYATSAQAAMLEGLKEGKLNFRNLHDYSQGKLAGPLVANYLKLNHNTFMSLRSSVATVMLFLAVPNITFNSGSEEPLAFFTCGWQEQEGISLSGLFSVFDLYIWLCITTLCLAGGPIIALVAGFTDKECKPLDVIIMPIKTLLDQGDRLAGNESKVGFIYWISGAWLLTAVVLSNAYKGENITALTSPLKSIGLQNISQLLDLNFTILTPIIEVFSQRDNVRKQYDDNNCYNSVNGSELCKEPQGVYQNFIYHNIKDIKSNLGKSDLEFFTKTLYSKVALIDEDLYPLEERLAKNEGFRNCSKIALLGWSNQIEHLAQRFYLDLPQGRHLSLVKDGRISRQSGWFINNWEDERIIWRLRYLIQSGIADEWRRIDERGAKKRLWLTFQYTAALARAKAQNYPTPISLKDNTLSVFVLFPIGILISIVPGLVELRHLLLLAMKHLYWGAVKGLKALRNVLLNRSSSVIKIKSKSK